MERLQQDIAQIKSDVKDILKLLNGNGTSGIITKVALNKEAIRRAWWWLGGISISIMGIAFFVIKSAIR